MALKFSIYHRCPLHFQTQWLWLLVISEQWKCIFPTHFIFLWWIILPIQNRINNLLTAHSNLKFWQWHISPSSQSFCSENVELALCSHSKARQILLGSLRVSIQTVCSQRYLMIKSNAPKEDLKNYFKINFYFITLTADFGISQE